MLRFVSCRGYKKRSTRCGVGYAKVLAPLSIRVSFRLLVVVRLSLCESVCVSVCVLSYHLSQGASQSAPVGICGRTGRCHTEIRPTQDVCIFLFSTFLLPQLLLREGSGRPFPSSTSFKSNVWTSKIQTGIAWSTVHILLRHREVPCNKDEIERAGRV